MTKPKDAVYGNGHLELHNGKYRYIFYRDGRRIRESLGTADLEVAQKRLVAFARKREEGDYITPTERRATVDEILDDYLVDLKNRLGESAVPPVRSHAKAIRKIFGSMKAIKVTLTAIQRQQEAWLEEGLAKATINRRFEPLKFAFGLAKKGGKVKDVPFIPKLSEKDNVREGFIEPADFDALLAALKDPDLVDMVEWGFLVGMRSGTIRSLDWSMYRPGSCEFQIPGRLMKGREPQYFKLSGRFLAVIERRMAARVLDCPLIFHRGGRPIVDIRKAWTAATNAAGFAGLLFHDLRRSAVRNMIAAGIPEAVAMKISGHRTPAMLWRYGIVSGKQIEKALIDVGAYLEHERGKTRKIEPIRKEE